MRWTHMFKLDPIAIFSSDFERHLLFDAYIVLERLISNFSLLEKIPTSSDLIRTMMTQTVWLVLFTGDLTYSSSALLT